MVILPDKLGKSSYHQEGSKIQKNLYLTLLKKLSKLTDSRNKNETPFYFLHHFESNDI